MSDKPERYSAFSSSSDSSKKKKKTGPPFFFLPFCICWPNMPRMHTTGPNRHVNKEDMFLSRAAETLRHCDLGQWAKQSHCHRRLPLPRLHTGYEQFPPSPLQKKNIPRNCFIALGHNWDIRSHTRGLQSFTSGRRSSSHVGGRRGRTGAVAQNAAPR